MNTKINNAISGRLGFLGLLLLLLPADASAQELSSTEDSIRYFLKESLDLVSENALYSERVDWISARQEIQEKAAKMDHFNEVFPEMQKLFDQMQDNHSFFYYDNRKYASNYGQLSEDDIREPLMDAFNGGQAVVKAIKLDKYGYIRIPPDNSSDDFKAMQQSAQKIQQNICDIYEEDIRGWIVDLRLNTGGNMYPMIEGIRQLLGEGTFAHIKKKNGTIIPWSLKSEGIYQGDEQITQLASACLPDQRTKPVVLLTSQITGSSGEITALAFEGRGNTYVIGEKSAGFMTSNELYRLPFETMLLLAEGHETDRNGRQVNYIMPDLEMVAGDYFEKLNEDLKVKAALKWLKTH